MAQGLNALPRLTPWDFDRAQPATVGIAATADGCSRRDNGAAPYRVVHESFRPAETSTGKSKRREFPMESSDLGLTAHSNRSGVSHMRKSSDGVGCARRVLRIPRCAARRAEKVSRSSTTNPDFIHREGHFRNTFQRAGCWQSEDVTPR